MMLKVRLSSVAKWDSPTARMVAARGLLLIRANSPKVAPAFRVATICHWSSPLVLEVMWDSWWLFLLHFDYLEGLFDSNLLAKSEFLRICSSWSFSFSFWSGVCSSFYPARGAFSSFSYFKFIESLNATSLLVCCLLLLYWFILLNSGYNEGTFRLCLLLDLSTPFSSIFAMSDWFLVCGCKLTLTLGAFLVSSPDPFADPELPLYFDLLDAAPSLPPAAELTLDFLGCAPGRPATEKV